MLEVIFNPFDLIFLVLVFVLAQHGVIEVSLPQWLARWLEPQNLAPVAAPLWRDR